MIHRYLSCFVSSKPKRAKADAALTSVLGMLEGSFLFVYRNFLAIRQFSFASRLIILLLVVGVFLLAHPVMAGTETQLTTDVRDQLYPAISGNKIVWWDLRNVGTDIYIYDLMTQTEIRISNGYGYYNPSISGDKIVWVDYRNGVDNSAIYM